MKTVPAKKWRKLTPKQKKMVKMNAAKKKRADEAARAHVINRFLASTPFEIVCTHS